MRISLIMALCFYSQFASANFSCLTDLLLIQRHGQGVLRYNILPSRMTDELNILGIRPQLETLLGLNTNDPLAVSFFDTEGNLVIIGDAYFRSFSEADDGHILLNIQSNLGALVAVPLNKIFSIYPEHLHDFAYLLRVSEEDALYLSRMDHSPVFGGQFVGLDTRVNLSYRFHNIVESLSLEGDPVLMLSFPHTLEITEDNSKLLAEFYFKGVQPLFDDFMINRRTMAASALAYRRHFMANVVILKTQLAHQHQIDPIQYSKMIEAIDHILIPHFEELLANYLK